MLCTVPLPFCLFLLQVLLISRPAWPPHSCLHTLNFSRATKAPNLWLLISKPKFPCVCEARKWPDTRLPRSAETMTKTPRHIEDLADELIGEVLLFLVPIENQSVASSPTNLPELSPGLNERPTHVYGEQTELDRFRLVCKRFLRISTPKKFARFHLRFSRRGFQRLEELMQWQLACHVKHFTYMVRPFYQESGNRLLNKQSPLTRLEDSEHSNSVI